MTRTLISVPPDGHVVEIEAREPADLPHDVLVEHRREALHVLDSTPNAFDVLPRHRRSISQASNAVARDQNGSGALIHGDMLNIGVLRTSLTSCVGLNRCAEPDSRATARLSFAAP